jgi:hypothetical protein
LLDDPRRHQRLRERCAASIHDRRLGSIEVDLQIVDGVAGNRRQHVFDRMHGNRIFTELCVSLGQHRAVGSS